jgi:hypothetical protein
MDRPDGNTTPERLPGSLVALAELLPETQSHPYRRWGC